MFTWISHGCICVPHHLSGSSQCTNPEHPASWIEPGLAIYFTYVNIHVSMLFSQIILPSPSPTESNSLFFTFVSLLDLHSSLRHLFFSLRQTDVPETSLGWDSHLEGHGCVMSRLQSCSRSWVLDGVPREWGVLFRRLWLGPRGVTGVSSALRSIWLGCGCAGL